ncbi:MAG TPA: hypothetical protein PKE38_11630 [Ignavibacteriaceae bacterium]|nr:hypothetical protein [Ignavibacteriaceae bacterium]
MKNNLLLSLILLFSVYNLSAQSSSVYSRYGIGDLEFGYSAKMLSIGEIGTTQLDPDHLVVSNPASWSALNKTRIEFSFGYRGVLISDANQSNYTSETDFKGFTFGFPVSREYGVGVVTGLVPYSRVSYKAVENNKSSDELFPSYDILYEGKGGLSKIFLGSSVSLPLGFSAGATLDYYFGNQNYLSTVMFENSKLNTNTIYENNRRTTGFGTTVGLISSNLANDFKLDVFSDLRFGLSFNYLGNLNTDSIYTSTAQFILDTISIAEAEMKIPARLNAGISFAFSGEYNVSFDYMLQPMSKFSFNNKPDENLRDANKFSAAFEFKPMRKIGMTNWEQIVWRFGLSYEQTKYIFNGQGINQYSIFGGLSYPLGVDNSIDLAVQYLTKGTTENNLINENAIRVYLGVSFGELWFLNFEK